MIQPLYYQRNYRIFGVSPPVPFCGDHLDDIERRFYEESSFKGVGTVIDRKDGKTHESVH